MQDEDRDQRNQLCMYILGFIAQPLGTPAPAEPPLLGEDFAFSFGRRRKALMAIKNQVVEYLFAIPLDQLRAGFTERGVPKTDEYKKWHAKQRTDFEAWRHGLSSWEAALLFPDRTFAKYDYWSKTEFFTLDEILWLSVGLEPLEEFNRALGPVTRTARDRDPVVSHMVGRRELFRRRLDPNNYDLRHTAQTVLSWANEVQLELHPGCLRMLEAMVQRKAFSGDAAPVVVSPTAGNSGDTDTAQVVPNAETNTKRLDPRERLGMAKLLVAMAIKEYGFDPTSKRSPIPAELEGIAAQLGLEITQETILKYLRLGAQHLPKNWKAHE